MRARRNRTCSHESASEALSVVYEALRADAREKKENLFFRERLHKVLAAYPCESVCAARHRHRRPADNLAYSHLSREDRAIEGCAFEATSIPSFGLQIHCRLLNRHKYPFQCARGVVVQKQRSSADKDRLLHKGPQFRLGSKETSPLHFCYSSSTALENEALS
jgi:hypothetical protein